MPYAIEFLRLSGIAEPGALTSEIGAVSGGEVVNRTHSYGVYARLVGTSSSIEGKIYRSSVRLDEFSRPKWKGFVAETDGLLELSESQTFDASTGIATSVSDATPSDPSDPEYSRIMAMDAFGNVSHEQRRLGSTVFDVQRSYYPATALAQSIRAGVNLGSGIKRKVSIPLRQHFI